MFPYSAAGQNAQGVFFWLSNDPAVWSKQIAVADSLVQNGNKWGFTGNNYGHVEPTLESSYTTNFSLSGIRAAISAARLFNLSTHGNEADSPIPAVVMGEIYTSPTARQQAWNHITHPCSEAYFGAPLQDTYDPPGPDTAITGYPIVYAPATLNSACSVNTPLEAASTAVLGWCCSAPFASAFTSLGAKAVFATDAFFEFAHYEQQGTVWATYSCKRWPPIHNTAKDANDLLGKVSSVLKLQSGSIDQMRADLSRDCSIPDAVFQACGVFPGTIFWRATEEDVQGYYVCGFSSRKREPDCIYYQPRDPNGDNGRTVFYSIDVSESMPWWEIIAVDAVSGAAEQYSGFLASGSRPQQIDAWAANPIEVGPAEALARAATRTSVPCGLLAEVDGEWTSVSSSTSNSERVQSPGGGIAGGSCISCEVIATPGDSTACCDYLYYTSADHIQWGVDAAALQQQYLPGRIGIAWSGSPSPIDPDRVREALRYVICKNLAWNTWATQYPTITRRFPEAVQLVLLGTPGVLTSGAVVGSLIDYEISEDSDGLCGGPTSGCLVDGKMASPWLACPDSIACPYTRVPAATHDEIIAAFTAAKEYSQGLFVDPQQRVGLWAGDVGNNSIATECYTGPIDSKSSMFLEQWGNVLSHGKYPTVKQSLGCLTAQQMVDSELSGAGNGLALILGLGNMTSEYVMPGSGLTLQSDVSRKQRAVALFPSCFTTLMYGHAGQPSGPTYGRLRNLLFNNSQQTQFVFSVGATSRTYYHDDEELLRLMLVELDASRGQSATWPQIVFRAQQSMGKANGRWKEMQRISSIGAPAKVPSNMTSAVGEAQGIPRVPQIRAVPNPSIGSAVVSIEFTIPIVSKAVVRVFDIAGREIKTLADATYTPGGHIVLWDGTATSGVKVGSGVYFVMIQAAGRRATGKMLLLK